ncbi:hypothetical protein McanMca71_000600 [Microsporum canis]
MSLPPERIRIKRRREDEPVETLYIQSDIHQPKRRFTDYVFQRVVLHGSKDGSRDGLDGGLTSEHQLRGRVKGNRAVTVSHHAAASGNAVDHSGIPIITTPSTRGDVTKLKQKQPNTPEGEEHDGTDKESARSDSPSLATLASIPRVISPGKRPDTMQTNGSSIRRFHLEAPSSTDDLEDTLDVLHRVGGGIQKKRSRKTSSYRPVIVENIVVTNKNATDKTSTSAKESLERNRMTRPKPFSTSSGNRHTANQEQTSERTRKGESILEDPSTWDHDSDNLANELARIALEMTNDIEPLGKPPSATTTGTIRSTPQKRPLKYKPHLPKVPRAGAHRDNHHHEHSMPLCGISDGADVRGVTIESRDTNITEKIKSTYLSETREERVKSEMDEDSDSGYVFDEFVRRPVHDVVADPSIQYFRDGKWVEGQDVPKDIGIVVITQDDSHFWDAIAEDDDEKDWDTEDEDSNAEDNPANEYPDEDLDFDDEYGDNGAIYRRFRINASDDEEYDAVEYDMYGYRAYTGNIYGDSDSDS